MVSGLVKDLAWQESVVYWWTDFQLLPISSLLCKCDNTLALFLLIITNNFFTVYRISANLGTKMCLYTPLLCAKFQGSRIWHSHFMAVFVSVQNEEEK